MDTLSRLSHDTDSEVAMVGCHNQFYTLNFVVISSAKIYVLN